MAEPIAFFLDGRSVTAQSGETIWEVAKREGKRIPHLCHLDKPGYRPDGNCRACMVEIEGERVLAASCIRKPTEGMKVSTDSERADKSRRMVFELLAADMRPQAESPDPQADFWAWAGKMGIDGSRRCRRSLKATRVNTTSPTLPLPSTSTPASPAARACVPAARCRSTTSSAWDIGAIMPCRCSILPTRWGCRPA